MHTNIMNVCIVAFFFSLPVHMHVQNVIGADCHTIDVDCLLDLRYFYYNSFEVNEKRMATETAI